MFDHISNFILWNLLITIVNGGARIWLDVDGYFVKWRKIINWLWYNDLVFWACFGHVIIKISFICKWRARRAKHKSWNVAFWAAINFYCQKLRLRLAFCSNLSSKYVFLKFPGKPLAHTQFVDNTSCCQW